LNGTSGTCIGEHACDDIDKTPNHLKAKPDQAAPVSPPRSETESPGAPSLSRSDRMVPKLYFCNSAVSFISPPLTFSLRSHAL
jgi:hypothetical protein